MYRGIQPFKCIHWENDNSAMFRFTQITNPVKTSYFCPLQSYHLLFHPFWTGCICCAKLNYHFSHWWTWRVIFAVHGAQGCPSCTKTTLLRGRGVVWKPCLHLSHKTCAVALGIITDQLLTHCSYWQWSTSCFHAGYMHTNSPWWAVSTQTSIKVRSLPPPRCVSFSVVKIPRLSSFCAVEKTRAISAQPWRNFLNLDLEAKLLYF